MVTPPAVRRVAPAERYEDAAARLYQALYGCTQHPAGLLHAVAAVLDAEDEGRFTLAEIAGTVANWSRVARDGASEADAWRLDIMIRLCERLCSTSQ